MKIRSALLALSLISLALGGFAQTDPAWGTQSTSIYTVMSYEFQPYDRQGTGLLTTSGVGMNRHSTCFPCDANAPAQHYAAVHLPSGASVSGMHFAACVTPATVAINAKIFECDAASCTQKGSTIQPASGDGCSMTDVTFPPFTIDNNAKSYVVGVFLADQVSAFSSVKLDYKLQVSPAPASATFTDVPISHPFFQFVGALAASGITAGCNASPPQYCPDAPLTRGQMAVFLARALGLHWPN